MQVAIVHPKNQRDILTRAATTLPEHLNIDQLITQISRKFPSLAYTVLPNR
jgi:hypothetical protein